MRSMRATLLWLLLGTLAVVMAAAGLLSYRAGLQEAGEMFDARLVQSTRVLVSLVDEPLSELNAFPGEPILLRGWHGQAHGVGEALAFNDGHAYENKLAFQVWDAQGRLLLRSDSAPARPLATLKAGYEDVVVDSAHWRAFTLRSPNGRWFQSAELTDIREELAGDIAGGTLLPLLLSLPLIALLVWWSVALATHSLRRMSHEIGQRDPERMTPLDPAQVPLEARGLVDAINGLLQRLDAALARERTFVADAAHELRTPISALKVHADNACHAGDENEREASQQLLTASVQRVERLVAQLLSLSRAESTGRVVARTRLDLAALAGIEIDAARPLLDARGQTLHLDLKPVLVSGDEIALGLLVRNLVENAARYAPTGATVEVRTWKADGRAFLSVDDSGPGIPDDERERVFDRFYRRLGSRHEGSGLGLAIVKEVVTAHAGTIRLAQSPHWGGLSVSVELPCLA